MAPARADEEADEEGVGHDALRDEHERAHRQRGPVQLQEGQQVHALVLGLLEQSVNEAAVALHEAQALQVANHSADKARHAGHRLNIQCGSGAGGRA